LLSAQASKQRREVLPREALKVDLLGQALSTQVFQQPSEPVGGCYLCVAVSPHRQYRQPGQALSEVLNKLQCSLVSPVEVVEDQQERLGGRCRGDDVGQAVE
jgi:hypothetical protein